MSLQETIERLYPIQMDGKGHPCPRCGRGVANRRTALSRYADVMVCDQCGMDEAMRDACDRLPLPFAEWSFSAALKELEVS